MSLLLTLLGSLAMAEAPVVPVPERIGDLLGSGEARIVRATKHDLGDPAQAFDGDASTLMRTPSINPAELVIEFKEPRSPKAFRLMLLAKSRYEVTSAATLDDLEGKKGSFSNLTGAGKSTDGEGQAVLEVKSMKPARVFRLWTQRIEGDDYVHIYEWQFAKLETADRLRVEMIPGRPEWKPFSKIASNGVVKLKAWAGKGDAEVDVTEKAKWSGDGFTKWKPGVGNTWQAARITSGMRKGSVTARLGSLGGSKEFTIEAFERTNSRPDVDVLFVEKTPRTTYDAKDEGNGPGWPAENAPIKWIAHLAAHNRDARVSYQWLVDGKPTSKGTLQIKKEGRKTIALTLPWKQAGQTVSFEIVPPEWDSNAGNNKREFRTNALSLGMWVDEKLWTHWHNLQYQQNPVNETFEDWGNWMVGLWNQMFAAAKYPLTPKGVSDRIRLDRVWVVPTHALPLNGGLPSNNPDTRDKSTDLAWGFTTDPDAVVSEYWSLKKHEGSPLKSPPAFLADLALIHELFHARYIIDSYGFDVHAPALQVSVDGKALIGDILPKNFVRYNTFKGNMGGDYGMVDEYVAGAWERVRGKRAREGNMNSPGVIGEYIRDLPKRTAWTFRTPDGKLAAGARIRIWQSVGDGKSWYAKNYVGEPAFDLQLDSSGRIEFEGTPLPKNLRHDFGDANTVALAVVTLGEQHFVHFIEVSRLNLAVWKGKRDLAEFQVDLKTPPSFSE